MFDFLSKKVVFGAIAAVFLLIFGILVMTTPILIGPMMLEKTEEISTNETAFLVPLEEGSAQGGVKFGSVEDLEKQVVRAQRVIIPQRQQATGRLPGSYHWIPTQRVVKIDRSQVTREWTKLPTSGTANKDQAIKVESGDSINFAVGMTVGCSILKDDSAKFLFYFAGKSLSDVVDTNVRGFCQSILAEEFGAVPLSSCPAKKNPAFKRCFEESKKFFKEKGLTIEYLGSTEGLIFDNPKIQEQFDRQFVAENEIKVAAQEKLSQDERNATMMAKKKAEAQVLIESAKQDRLAQDEKNQQMLAKKKAEAQAEIESAKLERQAQEERNQIALSKAKADREIAEEVAKAKDGLLIRTQVEVQKMQAEAALKMAENWKGAFPTYLPPNSQFLFGLENFLPRPVMAAEPANKK